MLDLKPKYTIEVVLFILEFYGTDAISNIPVLCLERFQKKAQKDGSLRNCFQNGFRSP